MKVIELNEKLRASGSAPSISTSKRRPTIGFLAIADFKSSLAQELIAGMDAAAKDLDVNLVVFCCGFKYSLANNYTLPSYYKKLFPFINKYSIDALVSWSSTLSYIMPFEKVEQFHHDITSIPVVCIGMQIRDIPSLLINNEEGIEHLMAHLIDDHGIRNIGFIGENRGYTHNFCNEDRCMAYRKYLKKRGIEYDERLVYTLENTETKNIKKAVNAFFTERKLVPGKDIQAIITVSDVISSRLQEILSSQEIQVPKDIVVTGFNNTFEGIRANPPLTTVDIFYYNYGRTAINLVLDKLAGRAVPMQVRMPVELIRRESCGCFESAQAVPFKQSINSFDSPQQNIENPVTDHVRMIEKLATLIAGYDQSYTVALAEHLFQSFKKDVLERNSSCFVGVLKKYFFSNKYTLEKLLTLQHLITEIRQTLLPFISTNQDILMRAENIFHQSRIMVTISTNYLTMTRINNNFQMGKLALIAADFSSANSEKEFSDLFVQSLLEFEIPRGCAVVPADVHTLHGGGRIIASHNISLSMLLSGEGAVVPANLILPSHYFPQDRYTAILQLCNHRESFGGYIVFFAGPVDIPLYDTLRMVISPSMLRLYPVRTYNIEYKKNRLIANLLQDEHIPLNIEAVNLAQENHSSKLQVNDILDCLYHFIHEGSDIDKFSTYLGVSPSTLIKKTKQLAGISIQQLHEKMKMEKAMNMLDSGEYTIAKIAEELGYSTQFYFSSVFKKNTGFPPVRWKKRIKE